eukprot:11160745-Lingulodinium_polyedra.AAC.1
MDSGFRARSKRTACTLSTLSVPNRCKWVVTQRPPVFERARVKHGEQPVHAPGLCAGVNVHHPNFLIRG